MKNKIIFLILFLISPFGFAGNAGGGGTGIVENDDEAVIFDFIDYDMVHYKFAHYANDKWNVRKISMPLRGIDPKYVEALKVSMEAKSWVVVKATNVNCPSYEIVTTVALKANRNKPQCVFPLLVGR